MKNYLVTQNEIKQKEVCYIENFFSRPLIYVQFKQKTNLKIQFCKT